MAPVRDYILSRKSIDGSRKNKKKRTKTQSESESKSEKIIRQNVGKNDEKYIQPLHSCSFRKPGSIDTVRVIWV